ncbi:MAG: hypothetical protein U0174_03755 [Polyangiaceae bacterium]
MSESDESKREMPIPIEKAPLRVQRDYLLRERRNSRIAIAVIASVLSLLVWALVRLFH